MEPGHSLRPPDIVTRKIARQATPILSARDHRKLLDYLCESDGGDQPFLSYVLRNKVQACDVPAEGVKNDVAIGGATVRYSVDGGSVQTGLLAHWARTDGTSGVVLVSSLLGATLIGMRVGQRAPLLCEDGAILSVALVGVSQPT